VSTVARHSPCGCTAEAPHCRVNSVDSRVLSSNTCSHVLQRRAPALPHRMSGYPFANGGCRFYAVGASTHKELYEVDGRYRDEDDDTYCEFVTRAGLYFYGGAVFFRTEVPNRLTAMKAPTIAPPLATGGKQCATLQPTAELKFGTYYGGTKIASDTSMTTSAAAPACSQKCMATEDCVYWSLHKNTGAHMDCMLNPRHGARGWVSAAGAGSLLRMHGVDMVYLALRPRWGISVNAGSLERLACSTR